MQRDEFLPLRVIRQELASGANRPVKGKGGGSAALRRAGSVDGAKGSRLTLEDLVDQTGVTPDLIARARGVADRPAGNVEGQKIYDETDREIVKACGELSASASPGATCACCAPRPTARRPCSRPWSGPRFARPTRLAASEAIENLETLAATCSNLTHLLLARDLRKLTGE